MGVERRPRLTCAGLDITSLAFFPAAAQTGLCWKHGVCLQYRDRIQKLDTRYMHACILHAALVQRVSVPLLTST
jgi:hypothetical protein